MTNQKKDLSDCKKSRETALVVQWLRLQTPVQGAWVGPPVRELDPEPCHERSSVPQLRSKILRAAKTQRNPTNKWKEISRNKF